ncbi:MAG: hypothetical protein HC846_10820 [Blastocatellia bacterium]|nr:hypothetical protein [Blastocatellia bacterium]
MTEQELLEAQENSRRMFPAKAKKSTMNMFELTEDDEKILDKVWTDLAKEKKIERVEVKPIKEVA